MSRKSEAKVIPPPPPPRDPGLVALSVKAHDAGLELQWNYDGREGLWLRIGLGDPGAYICAFPGGRFIASSEMHHGSTPLEALRKAYAALGVALDKAEDVFAEPSKE